MSDDRININIEEQRHWNSESSWISDGNEWTHKRGIDYTWEQNLDPHISPFAKGNVLEIACGFGRMTNEVLERCPEINHLYVADLNETCISRCAQRFGKRVSGYFVTDGKSLDMIPSNFLDFVFSYDSFVHMHFEVVISYMSEIKRVLKNNGYCSLHLSNLVGGDDLSFKNVDGRANFDEERFVKFCHQNSLEIVKKNYIRAGHISTIDDIFLVIRKN
jgi:ubiquinone/menaquinone biosynthesis C-methylase UbiE